MDLKRRHTLFNLIKQPHETYEAMGPSTSYYLKVFEGREASRFFKSWNWVAFFTSFFGVEVTWLLYRRMYLWAFLISIIGHSFYEIFSLKAMILAHGLAGKAFAKSVQWILRMLFSFTFTIFANALYLKFLEKKMEKGVESRGIDPIAPMVFMAFNTYVVGKLLKKNPEVLSLLQSFIS